jgi:hypothetical protein
MRLISVESATIERQDLGILVQPGGSSPMQGQPIDRVKVHSPQPRSIAGEGESDAGPH